MVEFSEGIFYVSGKIDANTASQLKEELKDAFTMESVVLDFSDVKYISSAGLRVLLELKKVCSDFSVINVKGGVYEIFKTTGFTEILKIERKLREISVDGCEIIGKGGTGTVYKVSDDMVVKVYNPGMPLELIKSEKEFAKESFILGIPTAIPFDVVKVGDSYGTCFELLNAISLGKALQLYPERYDELVDKYIELIKLFKSVEDTQGRFKNIKDILLSRGENLRGFFSDDMLDTVAELTKCMPESKTLVHGDLHTGNVMLQGDELIIIDMADITTGPANYDMLCLYRDFYYLCNGPQARDLAARLIDMPAEMGIDIWNILVRRVYGTDNEDEIKKIMDTFALLTEVNTISMSGLMPREFLEQSKDFVVSKFNEAIPPNIDKVKEGFRSL